MKSIRYRVLSSGCFYDRWPLAFEADRVRELREQSWANLRRRQRRTVVFKALTVSGLIFLICGSAALIAYALEW